MRVNGRTMLWIASLTILASCGTISGSGGSGALDGACASLAPLATAHAAALAEEGSDAAVTSGARLIAGLDGACR